MARRRKPASVRPVRSRCEEHGLAVAEDGTCVRRRKATAKPPAGSSSTRAGALLAVAIGATLIAISAVLFTSSPGECPSAPSPVRLPVVTKTPEIAPVSFRRSPSLLGKRLVPLAFCGAPRRNRRGASRSGARSAGTGRPRSLAHREAARSIEEDEARARRINQEWQTRSRRAAEWSPPQSGPRGSAAVSITMYRLRGAACARRLAAGCVSRQFRSRSGTRTPTLAAQEARRPPRGVFQPSTWVDGRRLPPRSALAAIQQAARR
jgi:hypothetical protein